MNSHEHSKSVLSKPNSVGILIYLLESDGASKMTFIQTAMGGNYDTIKNAVKRMEKGNGCTGRFSSFLPGVF